MRATWSRCFAGALLGAALIAGAGCERSTVTGPSPGSGAARIADPTSVWSPILSLGAGRTPFYPLAPGNRWLHERHLTQVLRAKGGSPQAVFEQRTLVEREITCEATSSGRAYRVERRSEYLRDTYRLWVLMREDASGLYEADATLDSPPPCSDTLIGIGWPGDPVAEERMGLDRALERVATPQSRGAWLAAWQRQQAKIEAIAAVGIVAPGTARLRRPPDGELLRLSYPLRVGARWIVRPSPRFESRVEGIETLSMPAGQFTGYRIPITSELFGPSDRVIQWYGRDGFLRLAYHIESQAIDDAGAFVGVVESDYDEVLTEISIAGRAAGDPKVAAR